MKHTQNYEVIKYIIPATPLAPIRPPINAVIKTDKNSKIQSWVLKNKTIIMIACFGCFSIPGLIECLPIKLSSWLKVKDLLDIA